ncbi:hypothetical protein Tco_1342950, partial [Tanacetum coccineum]
MEQDFLSSRGRDVKQKNGMVSVSIINDKDDKDGSTNEAATVDKNTMVYVNAAGHATANFQLKNIIHMGL